MSAARWRFHDLVGGRARLAVVEGGFRPAIDSVLLAAAAPARPGDRVLDLGIGAGAATLCLLARVEGCAVHGVDLDATALAAAAAGAEASGFAGRLSFEKRDIARDGAGVAPGSFDQVIANPPYLEAKDGAPPPDPKRARAAQLDDGGLARWLDAAAAALRHKGVLTLIHRADRLALVLRAMPAGFGGIEVTPLYPKADSAEAKRILVRARKGSKAPSKLGRGVFLHADGGGYAPEVEAALRHGAALAI